MATTVLEQMQNDKLNAEDFTAYYRYLSKVKTTDGIRRAKQIALVTKLCKLGE